MYECINPIIGGFFAGGVCDEFVAGFAEPVEFKPDVGGFVAFGAGEEAGP